MKKFLRKAGPPFLALVLALLVFVAIRGPETKTGSISYSRLLGDIEKNKIERVEILPSESAALAEYRNGKERKSGLPGEAGEKKLLQEAAAAGVVVSSQPVETREGFLDTLMRILPTIILIGIIVAVIAYQMGFLSRIRVQPSDTGVSFNDVAGCGEAIEELEDVRSFLQSPSRFEKLGARVPKGVLLYGPPGTGKTLLAKAVASEAGIPFYSASGSEFVEMFAGLGAKRVRQLFQQAKKTAPSIIFIDELDAVGGHRTSGGPSDGGTREADQTLLQILKEMDGFDVASDPVVVIGATNRLQSLDRALVRPGRFDRHISIDPPDKNGREEILRVHGRGKKIADSVDLAMLAQQTAGMTGADLALVLNESALLAARRGATEIEPVDVDDAYFRVVAGAKKQHRLFSPRERKLVAYHESGHALVGERLPGSDKLHKISIIPRGQSGGQTLYVSEEDVFLYSQDQLRDRICGLLAGRAAEEEFLGEISTGASDDLRRASAICKQMVLEMGMSDSLGLQSEDGSLPPALAERAWGEISEILEKEYQRARKILQAERASAQKLAEALLEEETLDRARFLEILDEDSSR